MQQAFDQFPGMQGRLCGAGNTMPEAPRAKAKSLYLLIGKDKAVAPTHFL